MMGRRQTLLAAGLLSALALCAAQSQAQAPDIDAAWRAVFQRPTVPPPAPPDNPTTPERVALGAALFADPRLSGTGRHSCASCHRPERAFTDGLNAWAAKHPDLLSAAATRVLPFTPDDVYGHGLRIIHYDWLTSEQNVYRKARQEVIETLAR